MTVDDWVQILIKTDLRYIEVAYIDSTTAAIACRKFPDRFKFFHGYDGPYIEQISGEDPNKLLKDIL